MVLKKVGVFDVSYYGDVGSVMVISSIILEKY